MMINSFDDFVKKLLDVGFTMGGGNSEGIYAVIPWNWNEEAPHDSPIAWHTGNPETDPWEWRIRVLRERDDIAYAKVFNKKSGFITKEWYPHFLSVRRGDSTFEEAYADGLISNFAKRIYETVCENGTIAADIIKQKAGFSKEDKSGFDKALIELQMKMYITICGEQKLKAWPSNVFCTTEHFWGEEVFEKSQALYPKDAYEQIKQQILKINPAALDKKIKKFIPG